MSNPPDVSAVFNRLAGAYDRHAALAQEVGRRLLERCEFSRLEPQRILDVGCGTGAGAYALKRRYRRAAVIGVDAAPAMLRQLRRRSGWRHRLHPVCADIARVPLPDQSVDLLFCNLALHWSTDLRAALDEFRRLLRPRGLLLLSTLGPGTLHELREAWHAVDGAVGFLGFPDPLELGDALLAAGLSEPVVDTDRLGLHYASLEAMAQELEATGSHLLIDDWPGWTSRRTRLEAAYEPFRREGRYPATFEIVYGTAFGPLGPEPPARATI